MEAIATPTQVLQSTASATGTDGLSHTKQEGGSYSQAGVPLSTSAVSSLKVTTCGFGPMISAHIELAFIQRDAPCFVY